MGEGESLGQFQKLFEVLSSFQHGSAPAVSSTQDVETRGFYIRGQPGLHIKISGQTNKTKQNDSAQEMVPWIKHLLCTHEDLNLSLQDP